MLRFIMEKNILLYVLAAACAIGVVSQMILRQIYEGLLKNTRNTGEPEGRFLQQLRQRFQYCGHLNGQVGDVQALIQKSLLEHRVAGISLHGFWRMGLGCLAVSLLCAMAGTMVRLQGGASAVAGNAYFWLGAGAVVLTALAYGVADAGYRSRALEICLRDYLENSGVSCREEKEDSLEPEYEVAVGGTQTASVWEGRRAKRRAKAETAASRVRPKKGEEDSAEPVRSQREGRSQKDRNEIRESLSRVKTGMRESAASDADAPGSGRGAELLRGMDPKEQEQLIREVLSEFLSQGCFMKKF
ncbi:MAG: hypothetical protein LUF35_03340 [Lachnospiraceae bacterium]|nr:hypothetical protein [Lachnospiraceae bacterium]